MNGHAWQPENLWRLLLLCLHINSISIIIFYYFYFISPAIVWGPVQDVP